MDNPGHPYLELVIYLATEIVLYTYAVRRSIGLVASYLHMHGMASHDKV